MAIIVDVNKWRHPYPPTALDVIGMIVLTLGVAIGVFVVVVVTTSSPSGAAVLGVLGFLAVLAAALTVVVRLCRRGLYLGAEGIRLRGLFGSRIVAWPEIATVDAAPAEFLGIPSDVERSIWVTLRDGTRIEAPVQRRPGRVYLRPVPTTRGGPVLGAARFDAAVATINERLAASRDTPST